MENDKKNITIPKEFHSLFWEVNVDGIDLEKHANHVIERFLEYGTLDGIRWLRNLYGDGKIREYILKRGYKVLSRKTLNFWKHMLELQEEKCLQPSFLSASRKLWNY